MVTSRLVYNLRLNTTSICTLISLTGADRPEMRDLNKYVVEQQAPQWETLGLELGLMDYHIAIIDKNHSNDSVTSCRMMLQKWLDTDPLASWSKLDDAVKKIRSPMSGPVSIVSSNTTGIVECSYVISLETDEE